MFFSDYIDLCYKRYVNIIVYKDKININNKYLIFKLFCETQANGEQGQFGGYSSPLTCPWTQQTFTLTQFNMFLAQSIIWHFLYTSCNVA